MIVETIVGVVYVAGLILWDISFVTIQNSVLAPSLPTPYQLVWIVSVQLAKVNGVGWGYDTFLPLYIKVISVWTPSLIIPDWVNEVFVH